MVIAKILSVQEELLNSSIINFKINNSDPQWNIQSLHQVQQQYSTLFDSQNLQMTELLIGTVTYVASATIPFLLINYKLIWIFQKKNIPKNSMERRKLVLNIKHDG